MIIFWNFSWKKNDCVTKPIFKVCMHNNTYAYTYMESLRKDAYYLLNCMHYSIFASILLPQKIKQKHWILPPDKRQRKSPTRSRTTAQNSDKQCLASSKNILKWQLITLTVTMPFFHHVASSQGTRHRKVISCNEKKKFRVCIVDQKYTKEPKGVKIGIVYF